MIKGLIFDLDGVIVDTAKYHYLAWKRLCDELGYHFDLKDNELLKGVSRIRSFEIILDLNNVSMTSEDINHYCQIKNDYYLEYIHQLKKDEILDGVEDFLKASKQKGYKIALGSASKNSVLILKKLGIIELFDVLIDGTKVSKAKPDPEVFVLGCKELGFNNEECIVFEDSLAGIEAAHGGGMKAVGVGNSEVKDECDTFISSFVSLNIEELLKKLGM